MKPHIWTWLVVQQLRIHLSVQGHEFHPWFGKIPLPAGQLSPYATTTEPTLYSACSRAFIQQLLSLYAVITEAHTLVSVLCNKRSHCKKKPKHHNEEQSLLTATREGLCTATKTQHNQKEVHKFNNKNMFSEIMQVRSWRDIFMVRKENCQPKITYPAKRSFK